MPKSDEARPDSAAWPPGNVDALSLCNVAQLARGLPLGHASDDDWRNALAAGIAERCAGLAWVRSGMHIRAEAPESVSNRWRSVVFALDEDARAMARLANDVLAALSSAGVRGVVLKGLPLAVTLYGDPVARRTDDVDVYVRASDRPAAARALASIGWRCAGGREPWHQSFEALIDGVPRFLEIHSKLVCDNLGHLAVPEAEANDVRVFDVDVPALGGDFLPVYLAAHLAQHRHIPLLWWIDFATLWDRLDADQRDSSAALASRVGLARCLAWAVAGVARLDDFAAEDSGAAAALCLPSSRGTRRSGELVMLRLAKLADRMPDQLRIAAGWIWPRAHRASGKPLSTLYLNRVRKLVGLGSSERTRTVRS